MGHIHRMIFFLYFFNDIRHRDHITSRLFRIHIQNRKCPKTIQRLAVTTGKLRHILQIYMGPVNFHILIRLNIQSLAHKKPPEIILQDLLYPENLKTMRTLALFIRVRVF